MVNLLVNFLNVFEGLNKTIIMFILFIVTCVFRVRGYIDSDNWGTVLRATVVAYFGTHMVEHYTAMVKERLTAKGKEEVTEIVPAEQGNDP
jgi:hypothetical protein